MINGEPLREKASIRDFCGGKGCHVASALEEALLLPTDMAELRSIRRNEVFLNLKRYLGMVCTHPLSLSFTFTLLWLSVRLLTLFLQAVQAVFRVEEITNFDYRQLDDERNRHVAVVDAFNIVDQSNEDLRKKLKEEEQARRSAEFALEGAQKQAEDQRLLLCDTKSSWLLLRSRWRPFKSSWKRP